MNLDTVLGAIGYTETSSFGEFCSALKGDRPQTGDREGWRDLFGLIRRAEAEGLVVVEREIVEGRELITLLALTAKGADRVRALKDKARPLFGGLS